MLTYGYGGLCLSPNIGYFLFYSSRISVCMANGNVRHLTWISVVHHMPIEFFYPTSAVKPSVWYVCEKERESALRSQIARSHMLFLTLFTWFAPFMLYIACQNGWLGMCIFAFICRWLYRWFVGKWDTKAEIDRHFIVSHISMAYRCRKRPPVVFFMFPR